MNILSKIRVARRRYVGQTHCGGCGKQLNRIIAPSENRHWDRFSGKELSQDMLILWGCPDVVQQYDGDVYWSTTLTYAGDNTHDYWYER